VKSWGEKWLDVKRHELRPNAYDGARTDLTKWIIPTIGHRRLDQISAGDVRSVATACFDAGRKGATAEHAQSTLLSLLNSAVADGLTVAPAALATKKVARNRPDRLAIPLDDALTILAAASTLTDYSRWGAAFLEGLRPGEARGLTWNHVDLDRHRMDISWQLQPLPYNRARDRTSGFRIPRDYEVRQLWHSYHLVRPKTGAGERWIPLIPWMETALQEWHRHAPKNEWGLVWPRADGKPKSDHVEQREWRDLCDLAQTAYWDDSTREGRRWDLYEARHTCASLLRQLKVPNDVITAIMGHETIASTEAYIDIDIDQAREALAQVAEKLQLTNG
jgi:integrase